MAIRLKDTNKRMSSGNHQDTAIAECNGNGEKNVAAGTDRKKMAVKKQEPVGEPVVVRVHRTVKQNGDRENQQENIDQDGSDDPETIEIRPFVTQPAVVTYKYEVTRSVRYQSVTLGVQVALPCYVEEIDSGVEEAKQICVRRLKLETKKMGEVLDFLVDKRNEAEQSLNGRGMP